MATAYCTQMVMPLVDEAKPKCYLCHEVFENIERLRNHQEFAHKEFLDFHRKNQRKDPAPGDVTVF